MQISEAPSLASASSLLAYAMEYSSFGSNKIESLFSLTSSFALFSGSSSPLRQQFEYAQVDNRRECGTQFWSYPSFMNYRYMLCFFPTLKGVSYFTLFCSFFEWQEDKPDIQYSAVARTGCVYKWLSQTVTSKEWKMFSQIALCFSFSSTPHFPLSNSCSNCKRHDSKILSTWNSTKRELQRRRNHSLK